MTVPVLIFSDAPSASSGLARITRELATRITSNLGQEVRVATVGYGACGDPSLPFFQFSWTYNDEWIIHDLPEIWNAFAGDQHGILLTIQDATRIGWIGHPETCSDIRVGMWLQEADIERWAYVPIDACGPQGRLSSAQGNTLLGFDRILTYTHWALGVVAKTIGVDEAEQRDLDFLPHGIDTRVFYPRERKGVRQNFGKIMLGREDLKIEDDELLVGIVATNQARKDFGLAAQALADLCRSRKTRIWIHTDTLKRYWDIQALLFDAGVPQGVFVSLGDFPDDLMAQFYSACDVTLGIGLGEGFGFPLFESLACGTPVVHGKYAGAVEFLPKRMLAEAIGYRLEGQHHSVRPVFNPLQWSAMIRNSSRKDVHLPEELQWETLWPKWEQWIRRGIKKRSTSSPALEMPEVTLSPISESRESNPSALPTTATISKTANTAG